MDGIFLIACADCISECLVAAEILTQ